MFFPEDFLGEKQIAQIRAFEQEQDMKWAKERGQELPYYGAIGGSLTYCFKPTSIGVISYVKHVNGETLNITDYESW